MTPSPKHVLSARLSASNLVSKNITSYSGHNSGPWPQPKSYHGANMRTIWGVVNISGSLLLFLRKLPEGTTCQVLFALVAPDLIFRRRTSDTAEEILLPLLDDDFLDLALVLFTGIQQPGNIVAHATESGSHCRHFYSSNRDSSNGGNRTTPSFPLPLFHRLVD